MVISNQCMGGMVRALAPPQHLSAGKVPEINGFNGLNF
jgi:hypothetical protein